MTITDQIDDAIRRHKSNGRKPQVIVLSEVDLYRLAAQLSHLLVGVTAPGEKRTAYMGLPIYVAPVHAPVVGCEV